MQVLYLDCRTDILLRRFSETRRKHPLAPGETPDMGIRRELDLLAPIRVRADILLDTSDMSPHDLRAQLDSACLHQQERNGCQCRFSRFLTSAACHGALIWCSIAGFCETLIGRLTLRELDGRTQQVQSYVAQDPLYAEFSAKVTDLALLLLPAYEAEGKAYLSLGFGCTGGQHRSVAMAETLAIALADKGWQVSIRHRENWNGLRRLCP